MMREIGRLRWRAFREAAIPVGFSALLILLFILPWGIAGLAPFATAAALISVFYWSLRRPEAMTLWAAAAIGLWHDLLGLLPIGVGFLILIVEQRAIAGQRKRLDGMPFLFVWAVFALTAALALALAWLLIGLGAGYRPPAFPLMALYLGAVFLYPPLAYLMAKIERRFLAAF